MSLRGVIASFRFEGLRSLKPSRLIWWIALSLCPVAIALLARSQEPDIFDPEVGGREEMAVYLYVFVVRVLCPLALLLWATPAVHAEIEGKTWAYLAVRPGGKSSVLLGKYLVAVVWSAGVGIVAVTSCLGLIFVDGFPGLWWTLVKLVLLVSMTYGALYLLLGVMFLKRSMVVAVFYTLLVEVTLTMIPAVVNEMTIAYRLRGLLIRWAEIDTSDIPPWLALFDEGSPFAQIGILVLTTAGFLVASLLVLRSRQLVVAEE